MNQPGTERFGRTVVYQHEILRHGIYTRVVHWAVAIFFILALLSGFALFSPWLYKWLGPLFGDGSMARLLHPWFGLAFVIVLVLQLRGWWRDMRWSEKDRNWLRRVRAYATNAEKAEPDDVGKFNAGQKIWFWTMVISGLVFLITGIPLWFPEFFGRTLAWISYFLHDIAGLIMLGGFFVHLYEGTAAIPGTFHSMMRGTVREEWAWTHHPAWYREMTGRDPKADRERAGRAGPAA
jgi:formate dehydrogenase subunit gamma